MPQIQAAPNTEASTYKLFAGRQSKFFECDELAPLEHFRTRLLVKLARETCGPTGTEKEWPAGCCSDAPLLARSIDLLSDVTRKLWLEMELEMKMEMEREVRLSWVGQT